MLLKPDPTFYPSARMAMQAPRERHAYVALLDPDGGARPDGLATVDLDPASSTYGQVVHTLDMPEIGDELHHFGWNVCSAALCPYAPHPHLVSGRGESHPPALSGPDVTVSRHPAPTDRPSVRAMRCQWAKSFGSRSLTARSQAHALLGLSRRRLNFCIAHRTRCSSMRVAREVNAER